MSITHAFNNAASIKNDDYDHKLLFKQNKENYYIKNNYKTKLYLAVDNDKPVALLSEQQFPAPTLQVQSRTLVIERIGFGGGARGARGWHYGS